MLPTLVSAAATGTEDVRAVTHLRAAAGQCKPRQGSTFTEELEKAEWISPGPATTLCLCTLRRPHTLPSCLPGAQSFPDAETVDEEVERTKAGGEHEACTEAALG
jgi:hypothetical protein